MKRLAQLFIVIVLISSCKKSESEFIWEKSFGRGTALFIKANADSGFLACGQKEGKPYLVRLSKSKKTIIDFANDNNGAFSSAWFDTTSYIAGGYSSGKMLLTRYDKEGARVWEQLIDPDFEIGNTKLFYTGNGNLLALGSAAPDTITGDPAGLLFVTFDTTGQVISQNSIADNAFISATDAVMDDAGNIFLALTRQEAGSKPKASVARYDNTLQKTWETALFNNPGFGSGCLAISYDEAGIYVAGKTELDTQGGPLYNSFVTSLSANGSVNWSKYLEKSNAGAAVKIDENNTVMMLNRNCFIINFLDPANGANAGKVRPFSICDSYDTDALGSDFDISFDKNYLLAGTRGNSFYLALKPALH